MPTPPTINTIEQQQQYTHSMKTKRKKKCLLLMFALSKFSCKGRETVYGSQKQTSKYTALTDQATLLVTYTNERTYGGCNDEKS